MIERSQKEVWRLTPWLLVALLLGNFFLMAYDAKDDNKQRLVRVWAQSIASAVQVPVSSASSTGFDFFGSIAQMRTAVYENEGLHQQIGELETKVQGKESLEAENARLLALLDLKNESKYQMVPAKIIARDPSAWFDIVTINRGTLAGIDVRMPVVTSDGVAGRIITTTPLTSEFLLMSDDKSNAAAVVGQIGESQALGVIHGMGDKGFLEMKYVPGSVSVEIGQTIFTTGQDGIYPAGLKIGEISDVRTGSATAPHTIYVKTSAKIESLQEVGVLLYKAPPRVKPEPVAPITPKSPLPNANKPAAR